MRAPKSQRFRCVDKHNTGGKEYMANVVTQPERMGMRRLLFSLVFLPTFGISAENLEDRIISLEQRVLELEQLLIGSEAKVEYFEDPSSISPGTYFLETGSIEAIDEAGKGYVIYHATTSVKSGESEYSIQFGAGRKGFLTWQFYVDYNNDGLVDMDMIENFLDSLPLMGILSRSVDAEASQNIYQILIQNVELATHTAPEEITENASTISRQIWDYVQSQSTAMADWIKLQYPQVDDNA